MSVRVYLGCNSKPWKLPEGRVIYVDRKQLSLEDTKAIYWARFTKENIHVFLTSKTCPKWLEGLADEVFQVPRGGYYDNLFWPAS